MNASTKFRFKSKLIFGFSAIILTLAIAIIISIASTNHLVKVNHELDDSSRITRELAQLRSDYIRVRALLLEAVDPDISNREIYLDELSVLLVKIESEYVRFESLFQYDPDLLFAFNEIRQLADQSHQIRTTQIDYIEQGRYAEATELFRGVSFSIYEEIYQKIRQLGDDLINQNALLQDRANLVAVSTIFTLSAIGFIAVAVTFFLAFIMFRMIARISKNIKDGVAVLSNSTAEIQTTVTEISTGAAETATAISETSTTVEEIRQTALVANSKAKSLLESSQKATEVGERGFESSRKMVEAMNKIDVQMKTILQTITRLSEQNRSIGEITSSVSDLADQSNLLAVNAAIEAAKAGEHGRGFAVVAQEIRSLAEQSKKSTYQVKEILNEIQKSVSVAVDAINRGNITVEEGDEIVKEDRIVVDLLIDSISEAAEAAVQISSSSQQQMAGMDQIVPAMENIKQASEQNLTGIKQTQEAAEGLHELGQNLRKTIEKYRL